MTGRERYERAKEFIANLPRDYSGPDYWYERGFIESWEARTEDARELVEAVTKYKQKYFDRAENAEELTDEAREIISILAKFKGEKP